DGGGPPADGLRRDRPARHPHHHRAGRCGDGDRRWRLPHLAAHQGGGPAMTDSHRQVSGGEDTPSVAGRRSSGAASVVPAGVPAARAPLVAREIRAGYAERTVLEHLDIAIPAGAFTVIVGPN